METVYRIYTEDADRDGVVAAVTAKFESFTMQPTSGYYRGKSEPSIVIEIVDAGAEEVEAVARTIRAINGQKTVLVMGLSGQAKKIS
jgi:hypothetical protein